MQPEVIVGIDVSGAQLDYAVGEDGKPCHVANSPRGIASLVKRMRVLAPRLIVIEATGGLERAAHVALHAAGLQVAKVNARHVRYLAKAVGQMAKTDRIDARMLAKYGRVASPRVSVPRTERESELAALVARDRQLGEEVTREKLRLKRAQPGVVREDIADALTQLKTRRRAIRKLITKVIDAEPAWREAATHLVSAPGVGLLTAATLLAYLPELNKESPKSISMLAGVAPINKDSGTHQGVRRIWGGRMIVRRVLFMAVITMIRRGKWLAVRYQAMVAAGKKKKVAIVACMRKLLICLGVLLKQRRAWRDEQTAL